MKSNVTRKPIAQILGATDGNLAVEESEVASRKREVYIALYCLLRDLYDPQGPSKHIGENLVQIAREIENQGVTNEEIQAIVLEVREEMGFMHDPCHDEVVEVFSSHIVDLTQPDCGQQQVAFFSDGRYADHHLRVKSARHVLAGRIAAKLRQQKQDLQLRDE